MALTLSKESGFGTNGNYWSIISFVFNAVANSTYVEMGCWVDEAKYIAKKEPLMRKEYTWNGADNPISESNITIQAILDKVAEDSYFNGCVNEGQVPP